MSARGRALLGLALLGACRTVPRPPRPVEPARGPGDALVVCGERVSIGTPVVPWFEPGGYSAYDTRAGTDGAPAGLRYRAARRTADPALAERLRRGPDPGALREAIDLLVLHYDACGTSEACFATLQQERGLSVHFLLDVDGTLYQTLDLAEEAWHARAANPRSIGVEIAHVGAHPPGAASRADAWYEREPAPRPDPIDTGLPGAPAGGVRLALPERWRGRIRTAGFVGRPARPEPIVGEIHGERLEQYDFTDEQYAALARLAAGLARVFPRIALDAPRDAEGRVRADALTDEEEAAFHGVVGHYHLQTDKVDPGPAFDWERFLAEARAARAEP